MAGLGKVHGIFGLDKKMMEGSDWYNRYKSRFKYVQVNLAQVK